MRLENLFQNAKYFQPQHPAIHKLTGHHHPHNKYFYDHQQAILAKGTVLSHRNWIRQNYAREQIKISWSKFFEEWDVLICPQLATTAIEHDHKKISERTVMVDNQEQRYFQQIFWPGLAVNAHLPSTVFPTGLSSDGMPIGLQVIGGAYEDKTTIKFAELYEEEFKTFVVPNLD